MSKTFQGFRLLQTCVSQHLFSCLGFIWCHWEWISLIWLSQAQQPRTPAVQTCLSEAVNEKTVSLKEGEEEYQKLVLHSRPSVKYVELSKEFSNNQKYVAWNVHKESHWNFKRKMELLSLDMGRHAERSQYCNIVVTPNLLASMVRWTQLTFHQHHQSNEIFQPHIPYFQLPTVFLIGNDFKLCVMCLRSWRHTQTQRHTSSTWERP